MDVISKDCPIACLAAVLSRTTLDTLVAVIVGHDSSPATVGQVVELYEQDRLMKLYNISSGRLGEIRRGLVAVGLVEVGIEPLVGRGQTQNGSVVEHAGACSHCLRKG